MKTISLANILLLIIFLFSCREEITWDIDTEDERLVVEGCISTDSIRHGVMLTKTSDYFSNTPPPAVSDAVVTLSDGLNTYSYIENDVIKGWYQLPAAVRGEIEASYTLDIQLAQAFGESSHYTASTKILEVSHLDSIKVELDTINSFEDEEVLWNIKGFFQEREPKGDYYRFIVSVNDLSFYDLLEDYFMIDDDGFNGEYVEAILLALNLNELQAEDIITVEIQSVSEKYSRFISEMKKEAGGRDPIGLDGPSANAFGNISNGALGYFVGTAISRDYLIIEE